MAARGFGRAVETDPSFGSKSPPSIRNFSMFTV